MSSNSSEACLLCENDIKSNDFPGIISKALERKYCSNLKSFYFGKLVDKLLSKKRGKDYTDYLETVRFLEDDYFKRYYFRGEVNHKLKKLFPYYKNSVFKPSVFDKKKMRTHILFYYAKEQILRGEKVFDFSSSDEKSSTESNLASKDLQSLLRPIKEETAAKKKNKKGYFSVDISEIMKRGKVRETVREERDSEESWRLLATPTSKKDIIFKKGRSNEETNEREKARLLDITKKISSKKGNPNHLKKEYSPGSQDCTRKRLTPCSKRRQPSPPLADEFAGKYYLNLTALKPRRENKSNVEESDKSLAILVNLLKGKSEEKKKLEVIEEVGKGNQKRERRGSTKGEVERLKTIEQFNKVHRVLNFKKKTHVEGNQKKITFESKPVIDKHTQLVTLPFQKVKGGSNLVLDKKRLLSHLKKKKHKEQTVRTTRGNNRLEDEEKKERRASAQKKSLSPNGVLVSKMREKKLREFKSLKGKKRVAKLDAKVMGALAKGKPTSKAKTKRALSKRRWK